MKLLAALTRFIICFFFIPKLITMHLSQNSVERRLSNDSLSSLSGVFSKGKKQHLTAAIMNVFNKRSKNSMENYLNEVDTSKVERSSKNSKFQSKTLPRNLIPCDSLSKLASKSPSKFSQWVWSRRLSSQGTDQINLSDDEDSNQQFVSTKKHVLRPRISNVAFDRLDVSSKKPPTSVDSLYDANLSQRLINSDLGVNNANQNKDLSTFENSFQQNPKLQRSSKLTYTSVSHIPGSATSPRTSPRPKTAKDYRASKKSSRKWYRKNSIEEIETITEEKSNNSYQFDLWDGRNAVTLPRKASRKGKVCISPLSSLISSIVVILKV